MRQISPKAAYDLAMQPFRVTRAAIGNWSDTELAAMTVTVQRAATECDARDVKAAAVADLPDLVKLCALGQRPAQVVSAAKIYLQADIPAKPRISEVYAALVDADLRLKDEPAGLRDALAMLSAAPYDSLEAYAINEALDYMEFNFNADALTLAKARQPLLLQTMKAAAAAKRDPAAIEAAQSIHEMYQDGLDLPTLQQLAREPEEASVAALEAALPASLLPDDAVPIAAIRKRYALLGQPLPTIKLTAWPGAKTYLEDGGMQPEIPTLNVATALVLFPDWCAQCVRMGQEFPETVFRVLGKEAYLYGMLAETVKPEQPKDSKQPVPFSPAVAASRMTGTNTIAVDASTLDEFNVDDPPFLIVVDANGIVRVAQSVTTDATKPGNTADSAIAFIGQQWPLLQPKQRKSPPLPPAK